MEDTVLQTKTNGEFVEILLATEASVAIDAKSLLSDFLSFRAWLQLPATRESIESIAEIFSIRIFASLISLRGFDNLYQEKLGNIHEFLRLMRRISCSDFGIEIDLEQANGILTGV